MPKVDRGRGLPIFLIKPGICLYKYNTVLSFSGNGSRQHMVFHDSKHAYGCDQAFSNIQCMKCPNGLIKRDRFEMFRYVFVRFKY